MVMSVGCTRLLLASGSAPDRLLFSMSHALCSVGPPDEPRRLICAVGTAHNVQIRLIRYPQHAWPALRAAACLIPEPHATAPSAMPHIGAANALHRLFSPRRQRLCAKDAEDARQTVNFSA